MASDIYDLDFPTLARRHRLGTEMLRLTANPHLYASGSLLEDMQVLREEIRQDRREIHNIFIKQGVPLEDSEAHIPDSTPSGPNWSTLVTY